MYMCAYLFYAKSNDVIKQYHFIKDLLNTIYNRQKLNKIKYFREKKILHN